jgi:hypothetical protein
MEGLAFHELHNDVEIAIRLTYVMDGADIGMSQGGRSSRFLEKVLASGGVERGNFL